MAEMLVRRGDGALAGSVPAARGAGEAGYPGLMEQLWRWKVRRCGLQAWQGVLEVRAQLLQDFQGWAETHGRRAGVRGATVRDRVAPGMEEGAWQAGAWEVARPEAQEPGCAGCARCRRWGALERAQRVLRPGGVVAADVTTRSCATATGELAAGG